MIQRLLCVLMLVQLCGCGPKIKTDCEKQLERKPYFATHTYQVDNLDSFLVDSKIMNECGRLDSIDQRIMNQQRLDAIVQRFNKEGKAVTYQAILDEFREDDDYARLRGQMSYVLSLDNKPISLESLAEDRKKLEVMGMPSSVLDRVQSYVINHAYKELTYREAFREVFQPTPQSSEPVPGNFKLGPLQSVEGLLEMTKNSEKKRILIFFTSHASAPAQSMQDSVLQNTEVICLLRKNYIYSSADVDSKGLDRDHKTHLGTKYARIQAQRFKSSTRPYFYILDPEGKVLAEMGYTSSVQEFKAFLNKGLK